MRFQPAFLVLAASLFTGIQASHTPSSNLDDSQLELLTELGKRWVAAGFPSTSGPYPFHGGPFFRAPHTRPRPDQDMMYAGGSPGFYRPGGPGGMPMAGKREVYDVDENEVEARDLPEPTQMKFQLAIKLVKNLRPKLTESERISLWSLYQQATLGDINEAKEKAKLEAWKSRASLSKDEAKIRFNSLATALYKNITSPTTTSTTTTTISTKSAAAATVTVIHVPTVTPSTKHLWNMYSPPQNFNEPEFIKYNKKAEELHEKFTEDEKLKLFGLYKQSILGDNRVGRVEDAGKELGGYKPKERWEKWESLKGKNKDEARREYVNFVKELETKYKK